MGDALRGRIEMLQSRLEEDPSDEPAHEELVAALTSMGDWRGVCTVLRHWAEITADPETRVRALLRDARVAEEQLGDLERAHAAYAAAVDGDPGCTAAVEGLARVRALRGE
jgi:DNA-binding SARP family transcriptional activator